MKIEAIEKATKGLEEVVTNLKGILATEEGVAELARQPAPPFMPVLQLCADLLKDQSMSTFPDFEKACKNDAFKYGDEFEEAVDAYWQAEEDYEDMIKAADKALNLNVVTSIG